MGDKYEVYAWEQMTPEQVGSAFHGVAVYHYVAKYRGKRLIKALYAALLAKRQGAGMIKVEVR